MQNEAKRRIALLVPDAPATAELIPYLERIESKKWYTNFGPLSAELEHRLAHLFARSSVPAVAVQTVANATLGLELALQALGLPERSSILIPAFTFSATATAVVRSGHIPVFCDVTPHSWQLTPSIARKAMATSNFAAVLPVCAFGCPQDGAEWGEFATSTGIPVVIDAAGAFGNQVAARNVSAVFSLHATKSLGAGEGGFVLSSDQAFADSIRRLSNFGISLPSGYVNSAGTNAKLSEFHAAVALAALDGWKARSVRRVQLHQKYIAALGRAFGASINLQRRPVEGTYTILPVLLPEYARASLVSERLAMAGIETRRWYLPSLERHPAFERYPIAGDLGVTNTLNDRLLALPFHLALSDEDIEFVCQELHIALSAG